MKKDEAAVDSAQQLSRGMILQSPQKIFSHSTFLRNILQFGGYDVIGGEIYEKIKSKNCQAKINEKRNGPSLSHKTPIGETKAAPEAKQAANISRSNNFSFISLK